jgi:hypothetical protein
MSTIQQLVSQFDATPSVALARIAAHEGPIFVDLDETLYLRNSTEDFIDLARPGVLAALLLRVLDVVKPWRWSGGEATRDVWRVRLVMTLFPWVRFRWARNVAEFGRRFGNTSLLSVFRQHGIQPIVLTAGFRPIVTPLVAAIGLPQARIVAARLDTFDDRRRGKLHYALATVGEEALREGLLITDSDQDLAVLRVCKGPLRIVWPGAAFRPALADVYLPGEYLTRIKRPGAHYIRRGIVQEDFAFWVLSSIALAPRPWLHVLGLLLLLGSFWVVYEQGYVDNDRVAVRYESEPKVEPAYWATPVATPRVEPWIWALVLGALGVVVVLLPAAPRPWDFLKWALVLAGCNGWFYLYNRLDKWTRVWMYAGLQLARAAAFTVLVSVMPIGAVALGANALARWVPYHLYRAASKEWPARDDSTLIRLTYFLVLAAILAVSAGVETILNWTALMLLGWNIYRARHCLADLFARMRRLDRLGPKT